MGGLDSSCTKDTTNVFLEVALFDPICVTKTGRKIKQVMIKKLVLLVKEKEYEDKYLHRASTVPNFANSDGWNPMPPKLNQDLAPYFSCPNIKTPINNIIERL